MGMFDYIVIVGDEAKLQAREVGIHPDAYESENAHVQTKSLENLMNTYLIDDDAIYERRWITQRVGEYKEKTILGITADVSEYKRIGRKLRKLPHVKSIAISAPDVNDDYSRYIVSYEEGGIKITPYTNDYSEVIVEDWVEEYFEED